MSCCLCGSEIQTTLEIQLASIFNLVKADLQPEITHARLLELIRMLQLSQNQNQLYSYVSNVKIITHECRINVWRGGESFFVCLAISGIVLRLKINYF